ncbi:hypothetical protein FQZ97_759440 [compost metagenome]
MLGFLSVKSFRVFFVAGRPWLLSAGHLLYGVKNRLPGLFVLPAAEGSQELAQLLGQAVQFVRWHIAQSGELEAG